MKFYLLQHGHSHSENTLHVFDTEAERDAMTKELIYGTGDLSPDDQRGLDLYLAELREDGSVEFEGDPGLEWFTAHPAGEPRTAEGHFLDRDIFVNYICDKVNVARLKEGLACISMSHASVCHDVLTSKRYRQ